MLLLLQLENKIIDYIETDETKWMSTVHQTKLKMELLHRNEALLEAAVEEPVFFIQKRFTPLPRLVPETD